MSLNIEIGKVKISYFIEEDVKRLYFGSLEPNQLALMEERDRIRPVFKVYIYKVRYPDLQLSFLPKEMLGEINPKQGFFFSLSLTSF